MCEFFDYIVNVPLVAVHVLVETDCSIKWLPEIQLMGSFFAHTGSQKRKRCCKSVCTRCLNMLKTTKMLGHLWIQWKRTLHLDITQLSEGECWSIRYSCKVEKILNWFCVWIPGQWICSKWRNDLTMANTLRSPISGMISNSSWTIAVCITDKIMVNDIKWHFRLVF